MKAGQRVVMVLAFIVAVILAVPAAVQATTWYFRDSGVSLPVNGPTAHQSGEAFAGGTWTGRTMTLNQGATNEVYTTSIGNNTGNFRSITFMTGGTSSQTFTAGQTWAVHLHDYINNTTSFVVYPKIYIYEWIPGTGKGDVFLNVTTGSQITWSSETGHDISSSSGLAGTLDAGNYLCVDIYWYCTDGRAGGSASQVFGDADSDEKLTSPGTEVPSLGFWLTLIAISIFVLFAARKGVLKIRPVAITLLLVLIVSMTALPGSKPAQINRSKTKPNFYVTVEDKTGKEIARYSLNPVENNDQINYREPVK